MARGVVAVAGVFVGECVCETSARAFAEPQARRPTARDSMVIGMTRGGGLVWALEVPLQAEGRDEFGGVSAVVVFGVVAEEEC